MSAAKPADVTIPATQPTPFDARTAKPEEVEARLREITSSLSRRNFNSQCEALLANLREGR